MFDATKGKKALTDQVDLATDEFAGWFDDLTAREQLDVTGRLNDDNVRQLLLTGQSPSGGGTPPPAPPALPAPPSSSDPRQRLADALSAFGASPGQMQAVLRVLNAPDDPGHIQVEGDGTPSELLATRRERDSAQRELADERNPRKDGSLAKQLADAKHELAGERDPRKDGSLAKQLADATATPADVVGKADIAPLVADVEQAASQLSSSMLTSAVQGKDALNHAVAAVKAAVS